MSAAKDGKRLTPDDWRRCAAAGMTRAEAAKHLGRDPRTAVKMAVRHGIEFAPGRRGPKPGTTMGVRCVLTAAETVAYDLCLRKKLRAWEALCAIGRSDLAAERGARRRAA